MLAFIIKYSRIILYAYVSCFIYAMMKLRITMDVIKSELISNNNKGLLSFLITHKGALMFNEIKVK